MARSNMKWLRIRAIIIPLALVLNLILPGLTVLAQEQDIPFVAGLLPSPEGDYPQAQTIVGLDSLPASVDLSEALPPVRHQGRQASCAGWAIAYYYRSYQEALERQRGPMSDAEIFSPSFIYNQRTAKDRSRDYGMSMVDGLRIAVDLGVATMATMPYDQNDWSSEPSEEARQEAAQYRSDSYYNFFRGGGNANLDLLKTYLADGELILMAMPIYSEFYKVRSTDAVVDVPSAGSIFYGGHAVTLLGYDDASQTFKFVNSWGSWWGDEGFGYLTYDFVQQKAWEAWGLVDSDTTPPDLPDQVYELGGTQDGVDQSIIDAPIFAWQTVGGSDDECEVYWGRDPEGTSDQVWGESYYMPQPLEQGRYFLRLRARDQAGNETDWVTLFEFRYERGERDNQVLPLGPVAVRAS